jgi:hypothetical protein
MPKLILCLAIAASMLGGCAAGLRPTPAPVLYPPASLTTLDDPPPPPTSPAMADLYDNHLEAMRLYWVMRERYLGLIGWMTATGRQISE